MIIIKKELKTTLFIRTMRAYKAMSESSLFALALLILL